MNRVPRALAVRSVRSALCLAALTLASGCASPERQSPSHTVARDSISEHHDALPSWRDSDSRDSIVSFVQRVTTPGSPDFVPHAERIAVFDNDGTLWAEQPAYFQLLFAIDRVRALAPEHPEWATTEPFASLLRNDLKSAMAGGERALLQIVAASHAGLTTDEFQRVVAEWFETARHPTTGKPYPRMVYQPMLELLDYLRSEGFKTYIVSGGGVEFMRGFAEAAYGIPPEQVIGSSGVQRLEMREGVPVLVKLPEIDFIDDKEGKPIAIQRHIGRRPILAFGNSDGDLAMLRWTAAGPGPRFCAFVHHTDASREWAYDRESHIGKFDAGLDEAVARQWTIVRMDTDWSKVTPDGP